MPKVVTEAHILSPNNPILRRNQACHQCRRRKLKCDACRPHCATCVRSHAAGKRAAKGAPFPEEPDCTWDDGPSRVSPTVHAHPSSSGSKNKLERLESRISELESLLTKKTTASPSNEDNEMPPNGIGNPSTVVTNSSSSSTPPTPPLTTGSDSSSPNSHIVYSSPPSSSFPSQIQPPLQIAPAQNDILNIPDSLFSQESTHRIFETLPPRLKPNSSSFPPTGLLSDLHFKDHQYSAPTGLDTTMMWASWPIKLPPPDALAHLVDTFFHCIPLASRILHRPSFILSLIHPPNSPEFPSLSLLHAICAVASIYTEPISTGPKTYPLTDAWISDRFSFGETQAQFARDAQERVISTGLRIFEAMQSVVVLSWYYHRLAKWTDVWIIAGTALRYSIPLGLNTYVKIKSGLTPRKTMHVIPPPANSMELELRVNTWWCAYSFERLQMGTPQWVMSIDDADISQLFPVRLEDFEMGIPVIVKRQRMGHPNILINHPPELTDSFTLYIKSTVLLSRVRTLITRSRYFLEDDDDDDDIADLVTHDLRPTPEFKLLDSTVSSFRLSFPRHLRDPTSGNAFGQVDPLLYAAHSISLFAMMALHEPFANLELDRCRSADNIMLGCRAMLDLIHSLQTTSFDLTLLDPMCSMCWFHAGKNLIDFLKHAISKDSHEEAQVLRSEINTILRALRQLSQRLPIAEKHAILLSNMSLQAVDDDLQFCIDPFNKGRTRSNELTVEESQVPPHYPSHLGSPKDGFMLGLKSLPENGRGEEYVEEYFAGR